jgi:hypothetical protein
MMTTAFAYSPIKDADDIRVLVVHQGHLGEDVKCSLRHVSLNSQPEFEAISYAWGDVKDTKFITLNGRQRAVTISLYTALEQFRQTDADRVLWADAVCNNQEDYAEKSAQVQRIDEVYRQASRVLVWLGADTTGLERFNETFDGAHKTLSEKGHNFDPEAVEHPNARADINAAEKQNNEQAALVDADWRPMWNILERPWFLRKWIIQEVVLARDVLMCCGHIEFAFSKLGEIVIAVKNSTLYSFLGFLVSDIVTEAFENTANVYRLHYLYSKKGNTGNTVLEMVASTRRFRCSVDRDNLYSLVGLATDYSPREDLLKPDYVCDTFETYKRFSMWHLLEQKNADVLSLDGDPTPGLPSWVTNLSAIGLDNAITADENVQFSAGGKSPAIFVVCNQEKVLEFPGRILDTVADLRLVPKELPEEDKKVVPAYFSQRAPENLYHSIVRTQRWLRSWEELAADKSVEEGADDDATEHGRFTERRFDEFWRTIMCNMFHYRSFGAEEADEYIGKVFGIYMKYMQEILEEHEPAWYQENNYSALLIEPSLVMAAASRGLGTTTSGRLVLAHKRAQKGDKICVMQGASVPYIIRPTQGANYTLIGECYFHYAMHGEAWDREDVKTETIRLE